MLVYQRVWKKQMNVQWQNIGDFHGISRWNTLVMDFTGFHVWRWAIQWNFIMNNGDFMRFNDWTWGFSEPTTLGRPVNARRQTPSGFSLLMAARRCLCQDFINLYIRHWLPSSNKRRELHPSCSQQQNQAQAWHHLRHDAAARRYDNAFHV